MAIEFTLNGAGVSLEIDAQTPLLEALRNDVGLNGPKVGCGWPSAGLAQYCWKVFPFEHV